MVLASLEERAQKPIAQLFDLIAGTSTGGILALALTKPNPVGKPQYSARRLIQLYEKEGERIFPQSIFTRLRMLENEKFPASGIEGVLNDYFGETRLSRALTEVLVTSYEIEQRRPYFFKRSKAIADPERRDFLMKHVARATSAAPTYFEPLKLPTKDITDYYALIDGEFLRTTQRCVPMLRPKPFTQRQRSFSSSRWEREN